MEPEHEIRIREITLDDLPAVFHLGETLFTSQLFPNLYRTWDEYEVTGYYHGDSETCWVAEAGGVIAGFLLASVFEKKRTAWNYGHLAWLGVHPDYQRMGIARELFVAFKAKMEGLGVRMLLVDTQADNIGAIAFFQGLGFSNPTDHVYMALNLHASREEEF